MPSATVCPRSNDLSGSRFEGEIGTGKPVDLANEFISAVGAQKQKFTNDSTKPAAEAPASHAVGKTGKNLQVILTQHGKMIGTTQCPGELRLTDGQLELSFPLNTKLSQNVVDFLLEPIAQATSVEEALAAVLARAERKEVAQLTEPGQLSLNGGALPDNQCLAFCGLKDWWLRKLSADGLDLTGASADGLKLNEVKLVGGSAQSAKLNRSTFVSSTVENFSADSLGSAARTELNHAVIDGGSFSKSSFMDVQAEGLTIKNGAKFENNNCARANLRGLKITEGVSLAGTSVVDADLSGATYVDATGRERQIAELILSAKPKEIATILKGLIYTPGTKFSADPDTQKAIIAKLEQCSAGCSAPAADRSDISGARMIQLIDESPKFASFTANATAGVPELFIRGSEVVAVDASRQQHTAGFVHVQSGSSGGAIDLRTAQFLKKLRDDESLV